MQVYPDETELIQRAKAYDPDALGTIYERYYQGIYRYVYYRVGDSGLAEDLTGDIFMKMLHGMQSYSIQGVPFSAWLYRIARNRIIDHLRRQPEKTDVSLEEGAFESIASGETTLENTLQRDELLKAVQVLTDDQRQVIILKFIDDLDNATIASTRQDGGRCEVATAPGARYLAPLPGAYAGTVGVAPRQNGAARRRILQEHKAL